MTPGRPMERPDIYVIARILEQLWKEGNPLIKTRLQLASNLNYDILIKYLEWMRERGLISMVSNDGREVVQLTPKGQKAYQELVYLLSDLLAMRTR